MRHLETLSDGGCSIPNQAWDLVEIRLRIFKVMFVFAFMDFHSLQRDIYAKSWVSGIMSCVNNDNLEWKESVFCTCVLWKEPSEQLIFKSQCFQFVSNMFILCFVSSWHSKIEAQAAWKFQIKLCDLRISKTANRQYIANRQPFYRNWCAIASIKQCSQLPARVINTMSWLMVNCGWVCGQELLAFEIGKTHRRIDA